MSAMNNLRKFLVSNNLEAKDFTINATVALQKAYSKGDLDFYEPEVIRIELFDGTITQVIELSPAHDEVTRAVFNSGKVPLNKETAPKGTEISTSAVQVILPLDLTIRREEAEWELQDAMLHDTEGSEQRFQDARWNVFTLTEVFEAQPCSREVFDMISQEKDQLNDRSIFREFYAAWNGADEGSVLDGNISSSVRRQVETVVEEVFLGTDEDEGQIKRIIYSNFKVHPRHRPLFDAVVDDTIASRSQTLSR
jgi:hypothetical protein